MKKASYVTLSYFPTILLLRPAVLHEGKPCCLSPGEPQSVGCRLSTREDRSCRGSADAKNKATHLSTLVFYLERTLENWRVRLP